MCSGWGGAGVYRIPASVTGSTLSITGRSVDIRLEEHQRHIRLEHMDNSAVAEHSSDQGHRIPHYEYQTHGPHS
jgi:hypothetical protein